MFRKESWVSDVRILTFVFCFFFVLLYTVLFVVFFFYSNLSLEAQIPFSRLEFLL